jgi:antitoxin component of RelBE/YafQ-DinJ toxin-antitoxin module
MAVLKPTLAEVLEELGIRLNYKFEILLKKVFKSIVLPMSEGCQPELDDSPLCNDWHVAKSIPCYAAIFKW